MQRLRHDTSNDFDNDDHIQQSYAPVSMNK